MKIDIPTNIPWRQDNKGDYSSSIWSSRNIDLKANVGAVRPSHKLIKTTDSTATTTTFIEPTNGTCSWGATKNGNYFGVLMNPNGSTPPTVQNSWTVSGTSVTSLTKSITIPTGTSQSLVIIAYSADTVSATTDGVSDTTYNGVSLASDSPGSGNIGCGDNVRVRYRLYVVEAPTQTTADVVVTYTASVPNAVAHIILLENTDGTTAYDSTYQVDTTTGGATSLDFDADGDPIPNTGKDNHLLIASCVSSSTTHTQTGVGATELFNEVVGTVRASTYTMGEARYTYPQDLPVAFAKAQGTVNSVATTRWWTLAGNGIYQTSSENGEFTTDDASTMPTITLGKDEGDLKEFNRKLYLAFDSNLYRRTSSTWTTISTGLALGYKILETYYNRLYIASDTEITSMNTSEVIATTTNTLDLNTASNKNLTITCMRRTSNGLWIGTKNREGGNARMYFWDGATQDTVEIDIEIDSASVLAMTVKDDIPYILDEKGELKAWNGSFFQTVGQLDLDDIQLYRYDVFSSKDRWIHHNGMQTINDEILMAINTRPEDTNDNIPVRHSSGVYAWSPETGIYHKHAFTSQADSATITDYGHCKTPEVGALLRLAGDDDTDARTDMSDFFAGYAYESDNSTTVYAIAKSDKRGLDINASARDELAVIITGRIKSEDVQETWEPLYAFFKPLLNSTDKIIVKYRSKEAIADEMDITWVNTTSFTTTDSAMATIQTNLDAGAEYEFEGLSGDGAGFLAQITDISEAGGTYTVTLDQTITGATTNTASCRIDRWYLAGEFTDDSEEENFCPFPSDEVSTWIQYKVILWGEDMELERLLLPTSNTQTA